MSISVYPVPFQSNSQVSVGIVNSGVAIAFHGVTNVYMETDSCSDSIISFNLRNDENHLGLVSVSPDQATAFKTALNKHGVFRGLLPVELSAGCLS